MLKDQELAMIASLVFLNLRIILKIILKCIIRLFQYNDLVKSA